MKRRKLCLLTVAFVLLLSGCGKSEKPVTDEGATQDAWEQKEQIPEDKDTAAPAVYDNSLIRESITEEGGFQETLNEPAETYTYHVPQLIGDTSVIQEINSKIDEVVGSRVRDDLERMKSGERYQIPRVEWTAFWKDSLLSLKIEWDDSYPYVWTDYFVVNYDFKLDKWVSNDGLLAYMGVDREKFLWAARRAAMQEFDREVFGYPNEEWYIDLCYTDSFGNHGMAGTRAGVLSRIDVESVMICVGGDCCACVIPTEPSTFSERKYYFCDLDFAPKFDVRKEVSNDVVSAVLENNELSVSYGGKQYQVQGLYSDYKDIFLGSVSGNTYPYVFLVTEEGYLEFVNVKECAASGAFYAMPIISGREITAGGLYTGEAVNKNGFPYPTVFAEDSDGNAYDLAPWVNSAMESVPVGSWYGILEDIKDENGNYSYSVMANLSVEEGGYFRMNITALDAELAAYEGKLCTLGMTEAGTISGYDIWAVDGSEYKTGIFALRDICDFSEKYENDVLGMKVLSGEFPYDIKEDEISFYRMTVGEEYLESNGGGFFIGEWWDSWSGRCHMTITEAEEPGQFHIRIGWSDSAFSGYEWNMTGVYVSNGYHTALEFEDCVLTEVAYHESGNEILETKYTGGSGCISFYEAGTLMWEDYVENAGENCIFRPAEYVD